MNPLIQLGNAAQMATPVLSGDGTQVIQTITQSFTQAQLTSQLASAQNNLAQLISQVSSLNAKISSIQTQLALFPIVVNPPTQG